MISIEIGNSYSKIKGLTAEQEKELRNELSYAVGGSSAYFSGYGVRKKSLLSKKGEFPTGLLHRVQKLHTKVNIVSKCKIPIGTTRIELAVSPYEWQMPYEWQIQADKAAAFAPRRRGTISACTGSGKSLVIAMIAARLNVKTLVIVPTLEIMKQLKASINKTLGPKHKVTVRNIDSSDLKNLTDFDCLIIDEAHHSASKTYQKLNRTAWTGIYYRYFFTATPFRNDSEETLLFEAVAGQVIYELDYKTAVKEGYIVPVEAFYIDLPKQKTDAYTYQEVYKELIVNNSLRNNICFRLLAGLDRAGASSLCLVKEVQHGKNIYYNHFVHGEDEDSRELIKSFNNKKINGLVATTGILGEGVDTKPCEYVIIAGLGKAKSQFLQQVGRAVRRYPGKETAKVIIFRDASHRFTLRHFNAQKKILLDYYGIKPVKLDV